MTYAIIGIDQDVAVATPENHAFDVALQELEVCCSRLGFVVSSRMELDRLRIDVVEAGSLADSSPTFFTMSRASWWMRATLADAKRALKRVPLIFS